MEIINKKINYLAYKRGLYGNKLRIWDSINEYNTSDYNGEVSLRYSGNSGGMYCKYNVSDPELVISEFIKDGAEEHLIKINENAPDDNLLIQGEFTHTHLGYQLFYSIEKGKMRDCLKNGISISGISAKEMLRHYCNDNSFEDIMELINLYPLHVIEFSTYNMNLGDSKNRNTLIWEVRKY